VNKVLTDREKSAFDQEITKNWLLDYFYVFNNVPLHFIYGDRLDSGILSELELRNKAIVEGVWLDAYNLGCVYNIGYIPFYRQHGLMLPLQAYQQGNGQPVPVIEDESEGRVYRSAELLKIQWEDWMTKEGPKLIEKFREERTSGEWEILLGSPDRNMQLVSVTPIGNQVVAECTVRWTQAGLIKETAFGVVLLFDVDGTVLIDRSYCDLINWPSSPGVKYRKKAFQDGVAYQGQTKGLLDTYFNRYNNRRIFADLTKMENRNKEIVENLWLKACNVLDGKVFNVQRYRRQLPLQKVSYKLATSNEVEKIILKEAPDRKIRIIHAYAKGNQVIVECIISWTEADVYKETPFLSFLMLDSDGLIIRDRSYITLDHWPAAMQIAGKLDIPEPAY